MAVLYAVLRKKKEERGKRAGRKTEDGEKEESKGGGGRGGERTIRRSIWSIHCHTFFHFFLYSPGGKRGEKKKKEGGWNSANGLPTSYSFFDIPFGERGGGEEKEEIAFLGISFFSFRSILLSPGAGDRAERVHGA